MCEEQISTVLRPSNCIPWLQIANKLQLTAIVPKIQKMMQTSYDEIITTTDFKKLEKAELLQYLTDAREHGTCSDDLLNGALIWVKHDAHNRLMQLEDLLSEVQLSKCSGTILSKILDDYADLFDKQQSMYKLILSEVLRKLKAPSNLRDEGKTIRIGGGLSFSCVPNTACWILQDDEFVKYSELNIDVTLKKGQSACQIPGGLMLMGGNGSNVCVIFVLPMKMWVKQRSLLHARIDHASCFCNNKVFLIGGWVSDDTTASVDYMDMENRTWHTGPSLPQAESLLRVITVKSTMFVLYAETGNFCELDENKMSWIMKSQLPSQSEGCSLAASEYKVFAAGGVNKINYVYTPATDVWCCLTGPSLREQFGALVYFHQKLYLFPGLNTARGTDIEEYDISEDKWSLAEWKLPEPMWLHAAFVVDVPK